MRRNKAAAGRIASQEREKAISEQTTNQPQYEKALAEIAAGDMVVVNTKYAGKWTYELRPAGRVTATQIIIGSTRYQRRTGKEIGDRTSYAEQIYAPLSTYFSGKETYLELAIDSMRKREEERSKRPYVRLLAELGHRQLESISVDNIRQAAKLLGYKESE